jgi:hypothetical protein
MNGAISYKNQNYLRSTKEPIKPHLIAEDFDAVQITVTSQASRIAALEAQVAALTNAKAAK